MARQLTPLGHIVIGTAKWVMIPLAVGYIGYAIIGPRLGGPEIKKVVKPPKPSLSGPGKQFQSVRETNH
jgi:hypothetical protein